MSRSNGSHDAKVSAAAMQGPEQLLFIVVFGDDDASIRENDLCGELLEVAWGPTTLIPKYTLGGCAPN